MSTNIERAVEVMRNFWHDGRYAVGFDEIADALADAGLLAPDLDQAREWIDAAKQRAVLARLDREHDTVATSNPRPGRDEYTAGYLAGIDTAHTWLQKVLEGTHE